MFSIFESIHQVVIADPIACMYCMECTKVAKEIDQPGLVFVGVKPGRFIFTIEVFFCYVCLVMYEVCFCLVVALPLYCSLDIVCPQAIGQLKPQDILLAAFEVLQQKLDMVMNETSGVPSDM